ncbi:cytochrome c biogenesis protein CcdA [Candidatus Woesearchaeota archaeon]|nr:cytochrome c biogenesis protein CcdA [Candidatus Woesearchaeota archaeon]
MQLLLLSLVAFVAGMLAFLAPCTLPLMPAFVAYGAGSARKKMVFHTLLFGTGLGLVLIIIGVLAGSVGKILLIYKKEIVYVFAALMAIMGLMTVLGKGLFAFQAGTGRIKRKEGAVGSFLFGSSFGLTWTGCTGPVFGFALVLAASAQTAVAGGLLLFLYAMGMIAPLLLLSVLLDRLPKDGRVWKLLRGRFFKREIFGKNYNIHSTNLISGIFFIVFGGLLAVEAAFSISEYVLPQVTEWVFSRHDLLAQWVGMK